MSRPTVNRRFSDTLLAAVLVMATVIALAVGLASDVRGELIGDYDLTTGNATTSLENKATGNFTLGDLTTLNAGNSTWNFVEGTGWSWSNADAAPGAGMSVGVPANFGNYTIGLRFSFDDIANEEYQRLIRFNDIDQGMYVYGTGNGTGVFSAYHGSYADGGTLSNNTTVDFVLTRVSGNNTVTGYLINYADPENPIADQILTFTDTSNFFVSTGNVTQFFRDNTGGPEYSPSGTASLIRIWDEPLTGTALNFSMVPEPTTVALLAAAGGGAMLYLHRRRHRLR